MAWELSILWYILCVSFIWVIKMCLHLKISLYEFLFFTLQYLNSVLGWEGSRGLGPKKSLVGLPSCLALSLGQLLLWNVWGSLRLPLPHHWSKERVGISSGHVFGVETLLFQKTPTNNLLACPWPDHLTHGFLNQSLWLGGVLWFDWLYLPDYGNQYKGRRISFILIRPTCG